MRKMTEIIILVLVSTVLLGCIDQKGSLGGKTIDIEGKSIDNLTGNDWCKTGTNLTSVGPEGNLVPFEIKGITSHNGMQLCEADYDNNGTMVQYFNKNKSYNIMVIKSGNGTQEIDVNRAKQ